MPIGDIMRKDYLPTKSIGMHALLLDHFKTLDSLDWKKFGVKVFLDINVKHGSLFKWKSIKKKVLIVGSDWIESYKQKKNQMNFKDIIDFDF